MYQRIVYASRRGRSVDDTDVVDGIALPAIKNNRRLGVTGCLWLDEQYFLQLIEGEPGVLDGLYERIASDPRHDRVRLLESSAIDSRSTDWYRVRLLAEPVRGIVRDLVSESETGYTDRMAHVPIGSSRFIGQAEEILGLILAEIGTPGASADEVIAEE